MSKRLSEAQKSKKIDILREAWSNGANDVEACCVANITQQTLNGWLKENDCALERERDLIRTKPSYKARTNVVKKINKGDIETSKWYLERKNKEEFGTKIVTDINAVVAGASISEKEEELKKALEKLSL